MGCELFCKNPTEVHPLQSAPVHPDNAKGLNLVTGEALSIWIYCQEMRGAGSPCGPEAAWFEPREPQPKQEALSGYGGVMSS